MAGMAPLLDYTARSEEVMRGSMGERFAPFSSFTDWLAGYMAAWLTD